MFCKNELMGLWVLGKGKLSLVSEHFILVRDKEMRYFSFRTGYIAIYMYMYQCTTRVGWRAATRYWSPVPAQRYSLLAHGPVDLFLSQSVDRRIDGVPNVGRAIFNTSTRANIRHITYS